MADREISYATSELANTAEKLTSCIADIKATVTAWDSTRVSVSSAMNAATTLAEIAALSAQLEAQREALTLLESARNPAKKSL